jgi:hypothetical protein
LVRVDQDVGGAGRRLVLLLLSPCPKINDRSSDLLGTARRVRRGRWSEALLATEAQRVGLAAAAVVLDVAL